MSFESCIGCTDRYPGCHDHCERYQTEKAKYEARKAAANANHSAKIYTYYNIGKMLDIQAKRQRDNRGRKWYRR